jgi:hypothetical protein
MRVTVACSLKCIHSYVFSCMHIVCLALYVAVYSAKIVVLSCCDASPLGFSR